MSSEEVFWLTALAGDGGTAFTDHGPKPPSVFV